MRAKVLGFTLMELMIVVAIIGIIAAVAIPQYSQYVRRSQRAEAMAALTNLAAVQEKFYLQNNTYTNDLAKLNLSGTTEHGLYQYKVTSADTDVFTAIAVPASGSAQTADTDCVEFTIDNTGAKGAKNDGGSDNATNCWR